MTRKVSVLLALLMGSFVYGFSQSDSGNLKITAKPKDMWEVGIHLGHSALIGDVDFKPSFGAGLHVRKSLDYLFSLRLDLAYKSVQGEEKENARPLDAAWYDFSPSWKPEYKSTSISGELDLLVSLNQVKVGRTGKLNPYVLAGAGVAALSMTAIEDRTEVDVEEAIASDNDFGLAPIASVGAGLGFKLSEKISLTLEHKASMVFGRGSDLLDAVEIGTRSRDIMNYTSLRVGIALGDSGSKSAPLWWASPLDMVVEDLAEVKARPILDLTDTDGDGIIDMVDQEVDSPAGPVDTRGKSLDSDSDGVADYQDKEPYSPPGYKVDSEGVAQVPDPGYATENDVNRIVDAKIAQIKFPDPQPMDWFLPMVNFDHNRYNLKNSEYAKLHQVATVIKQNPSVRIVVKGYTDKTASNCYNDVLSYNRAEACIDYLTSRYGISRDRLVLTWGGEEDLLVPTNSRSLINRRVEFKVAQGEAGMSRPDCGVQKAGRGGKKYSGNKEAGY